MPVQGRSQTLKDYNGFGIVDRARVEAPNDNFFTIAITITTTTNEQTKIIVLVMTADSHFVIFQILREKVMDFKKRCVLLFLSLPLTLSSCNTQGQGSHYNHSSSTVKVNTIDQFWKDLETYQKEDQLNCTRYSAD